MLMKVEWISYFPKVVDRVRMTGEIRHVLRSVVCDIDISATTDSILKWIRGHISHYKLMHQMNALL
jgi:hypothetical protein